MRHLKDNNMTYWQHWWLAISSSAALFIHAWFPNILENYASKNILSKHLKHIQALKQQILELGGDPFKYEKDQITK